MSWGYWWDRYPDRLEYELKALDQAGIEYIRDEEALKKGILCLQLSMEIAGRLCVVFPDSYPYFRFEIYARDIQLAHHQNPFGKNLCMIGRATRLWHTNYTLASFLLEQLPKVIGTGSSNELGEVEDMEEHQAEPISDYYLYAPGTGVIVDGNWKIDLGYEFGRLLIGVAFPNVPLLRCAVLEVRDEKENILEESDGRLKNAYSGGELIARWVRLSEAPRTQNLAELFKQLRERDPLPNNIESYPVNGGKLYVRAALFPEEISNWRQLDYGWLFVVKFKRKTWEANGKKQKRRKVRKGHKK